MKLTSKRFAVVWFLLLVGMWFGVVATAWLGHQGGGVVEAVEADQDPRVEALFRVTRGLKRWHEDIHEDEQARDARLHVVARAIVDAARLGVCADAGECTRVFGGTQEDLEVSLLTVSWWETRLGARFHAGHCRKHECDNGRARGLPQIQLASGVPAELWDRAVGDTYEATRASMDGAAIALGKAYRRCYHRQGDWFKMFDAYARGRCEVFYQGHDRAAWLRKYRYEYRRELAAEKP